MFGLTVTRCPCPCTLRGSPTRRSSAISKPHRSRQSECCRLPGSLEPTHREVGGTIERGRRATATNTGRRSMRKLLTTIGMLAASLLTIECLAVGALAVDQGQGDQWGWAANHRTQAEADERALRECGQGCAIVLRFNDTCVAFAADQARGSTPPGTGRHRLSARHRPTPCGSAVNTAGPAATAL